MASFTPSVEEMAAMRPSLRWYYQHREEISAAKRANPEKRRAYRKAYYVANREKVLADNKAYRAAHSERVRELARAGYHRHVVARRKGANERRLIRRAFIDAAMATGCVDCGEKNLNLLDLDHVRGKKINSLGHMTNAPFARLFAEIDKCETRCANCHRYVTSERRKAVA